jgi:hypothetical protein
MMKGGVPEAIFTAESTQTPFIREACTPLAPGKALANLFSASTNDFSIALQQRGNHQTRDGKAHANSTINALNIPILRPF